MKQGKDGRGCEKHFLPLFYEFVEVESEQDYGKRIKKCKGFSVYSTGIIVAYENDIRCLLSVDIRRSFPI